MKKKILITGHTGQLGSSVYKYLKKQYNCKLIDRSLLYEKKYSKLEQIIKKFLPDFFINCAAVVGLIKSEKNKKITKEINSQFLKKLSKLSNKYKVHVIHFSTNSVFENSPFKIGGYNENDIPKPKSFYAKTKYSGENFLIKNSKLSTIMRISNLHSHDLGFKTNILSKIINDLKKGEVIINRNQMISPVNIRSVLLSIRDILINNSTGLYHCSDSGSCNWNEFIKYIIKKTRIKAKIIHNYDINNLNSLALSSIKPFSHYSDWRHGVDYSLKLIKRIK